MIPGSAFPSSPNADQLANLSTLDVSQSDAVAGLELDGQLLPAFDPKALDAGRQRAHPRPKDDAPRGRRERSDRWSRPIQHSTYPLRLVWPG